MSSTSDGPVDHNQAVIDEFRANGGKVGGYHEGRNLLLLHHIGARSGKERVSPLVFLPDDGRYVIFGSKGGAPTLPHWYLNLQANPRVKVEVGEDTVEVESREAEGEEKERLWSKQKQLLPSFAEYEDKIAGQRDIPVIVLEPLDAAL